MKLRIAELTRLTVAVLAIGMLVVALACAGEEEPAAEPTAEATPTTPAASTPLTVDMQPTATPVDGMAADLSWMERYLQSPGYDPAWGDPVKGGTYIFGAQRDGTTFYANNQGCCYTHGCFRGLPWSSLLSIDAWTGDLTAIEGELAESWDMSDDGLSLTFNLRPGIMFFDEMAEESIVPAEFNGGQILGDELVCEDLVATYDRYVWPPDNVSQFLTIGRRNLNHLESTSCPDGPRGHTFVLHFNQPLAKTLGIMAGDGANVLDKDYVAWLKDFSDREDRLFGREEVPDNFYSMHGTGPFIPMEFNQSVSTTFDANPDFFKEGLPLLDRYHNVVIKDIGSRFTALATGKIHYMGEGSWSMTPGQAEQAIRDFSDRVVVNNQLNHWARTMIFGARAPWSDVRVRKAIHLAIDRDGWLEFYRIAGYDGMKLAHTMAPGTFYAPTDEEIRQWPGYRQPKDEDVAEANRLMDEVFGPGERPTAKCMAVTTDQADIDACLYVQDSLKKSLGMEISSDFMEAAARTDILTTGNFDFTISSYTSSIIGDPDDGFLKYLPENFFASTRAMSQARLDEQPEFRAEVNRRILEQSATLDPLERKELVRELDLMLLNEDASYVVVGWSLIFPGWRVELKGWRGYDLYSNTKYIMHERMWIADN